MSLIVKLGDIDLNGSVILGFDQAVGSGALAGLEKLDVDASVVLHMEYLLSASRYGMSGRSDNA